MDGMTGPIWCNSKSKALDTDATGLRILRDIDTLASAMFMVHLLGR